MGAAVLDTELVLSEVHMEHQVWPDAHVQESACMVTSGMACANIVDRARARHNMLRAEASGASHHTQNAS